MKNYLFVNAIIALLAPNNIDAFKPFGFIRPKEPSKTLKQRGSDMIIDNLNNKIEEKEAYISNKKNPRDCLMSNNKFGCLQQILNREELTNRFKDRAKLKIQKDVLEEYEKKHGGAGAKN